jgi:hypothetical protein
LLRSSRRRGEDTAQKLYGYGDSFWSPDVTLL